MNTLNNHTLLYDTECPLCNIYTSGFVKTKMLDINGRKPFHKITESEGNYIDIKKAVNEIALIDVENKKVIYGIDSLIKVIGNSFPWMEKVATCKPIHFFLKKLYAFISYNRKVIIPSEKKSKEQLECIPDFNVKYRILYIVFTMFMVASSLFYFTDLIQDLPATNFSKELILVGGQVIFQSLFFIGKNLKTLINYIGNLMTVSLVGSIGIVQLLVLNKLINLPEIIILLSFVGVVLLMFFEHKRRIELLELPSYLSYTCVLYRLIALVLILSI